MQSEPLSVAMSLGEFLGAGESVQGIAKSLLEGSRERTGAGLGMRLIADADWSPAQASLFRAHCGEIMRRWGYPLD
jgi:hypothetical protein